MKQEELIKIIQQFIDQINATEDVKQKKLIFIKMLAYMNKLKKDKGEQ